MPSRFQYFSPGLKLLMLFLLMLAAVIVVSLLTGIIGWIAFGDMQFDIELLLERAGLVKFIQATQTILVFIVPSVIAAKLFWPEEAQGLINTKDLSLNILLASMVTMALSQLFIGWTGALNSDMVLPESWSTVSDWMAKAEKEAMELTSVLVQYDSDAGFLLNIVIIAFLPALGEEWLFRGHVQRYFSGWFGNVHAAIFVTAFLFSAMHLQFMTFLPRFFLGLILGYLFYLGKNIWYPVAAHFTNNFLALVAMRGHDPMEALNMDKNMSSGVDTGVVISAISVMGMLFLIGRSVKSQKYRL
jgi:membrane protease YdiL (CAAX protease family)